MKVLHARLKDNDDVLKRFVEEAQIGGQLQHPGIVPVYELGLQADERPFFTMKLVRGQTLGALLAKRRDPSANGRQRSRHKNGNSKKKREGVRRNLAISSAAYNRRFKTRKSRLLNLEGG